MEIPKFGFNEAAARCRGKHLQVRLQLRVLRPASMRPRPDAAENRKSGQERFQNRFRLQ